MKAKPFKISPATKRYLRATARLRAKLREQVKISPGFLYRAFTR